MALVNAYVHTPLAVALFKAEDQLLERAQLPAAGLHRARQRRRRARVQDQGGRHRRVEPVLRPERLRLVGAPYGHDKVLALDVGGTTAKLGVIVDGKPLTIEHGDLLGVPLKTPWTLLRSEAVGGGSIARAVDGELTARPGVPGRVPRPRLLRPRRPRGDADRRVPRRRACSTPTASSAAAARCASTSRSEALGEHRAAERVIDKAADMVADGRARRRSSSPGRGELRALLLRRQRRRTSPRASPSASASTARTCSRSARC